MGMDGVEFDYDGDRDWVGEERKEVKEAEEGFGHEVGDGFDKYHVGVGSLVET